MHAILALTSGPTWYACVIGLVAVAAVARRTRDRQVVLLLACWLFYAGWGAGFLGVLVFSSVINYCLGLAIRRRVTPARLWIGIGTNVALLVLFKYGVGSLADDAGFGAVSRLARPIGMSFWTLQALSYLFDTYHEEDLDPSLLEFCLFMAFAPTVLAGPISRLSWLLPQFRRPIRPTTADVSEGARRVLLGLFMKLIVADVLATGWGRAGGVNAGFERVPGTLGGLDVWFLAVGFGFQLFCDFAGYSHIVIGAARVLGFRLDENFDRPYLSPTPAAFWTRWHMSLSFWIRDYVFMPMTMMRRGRWWVYTSLVFSMVVVGAWHEAALPFVVWGAYHGLLLVLHRVGQQINRGSSYKALKFGNAVSAVMTFTLVSVGWLFFRSPTVSQAIAMCRTIVTPRSYGELSLPFTFYAATLVVAGSWLMVSIGGNVLESVRTYRAAPGGGVVSPVMLPTTPVHVMAVEAFDYLTARRWWWLVPILIVVGVTGGVVLTDLGATPSRTPFMYTLF